MLPASVLYIDINRFATYVEHYGEQGADDIRHGVAQILDRSVRVNDVLGCHGEQAFVAAMDCNWNHALGAAKRLVELVRAAVLKAGTNTVKVNASSGVAGYPDHGRTADRLLDAAHAAAVVAGERGRGTCLVYERSMRTALTVDGPIDTL
jgi:diguanylate cyclase (GGDEF)-like protein